MIHQGEGVVAQWCKPLTLQPEKSSGVGSKPSRDPPLERHDKGLRNRLALSYFCDPSAWRLKPHLHVHVHLRLHLLKDDWIPSCNHLKEVQRPAAFATFVFVF